MRIYLSTDCPDEHSEMKIYMVVNGYCEKEQKFKLKLGETWEMTEIMT